MIIFFFKKGDREDFNNYRGILLFDFCSKIFIIVLNKRFNLWFEIMGCIFEE